MILGARAARPFLSLAHRGCARCLLPPAKGWEWGVGEGAETDCASQLRSSIGAKGLNGWSAVQTPGGILFFHCPAGNIHPSQQTRGKGWDKVYQLVRGGQGNSPSRPVRQLSRVPCIQAAASAKLSCGFVGDCFLVPHRSNPSGRFSSLDYREAAYHHRAQASTIPIALTEEETKTQEKNHGDQCSRTSSTTSCPHNQKQPRRLSVS